MTGQFRRLGDNSINGFRRKRIPPVRSGRRLRRKRANLSAPEILITTPIVGDARWLELAVAPSKSRSEHPRLNHRMRKG